MFKTKNQRKNIELKVILKDFHGAENLNVKLFPESSRLSLGIFKTMQKREIVRQPQGARTDLFMWEQL